MNLTTEQIQQILDGAPEGATHIGIYDHEYFEYWKVKSIGDDEEYQCFDHGAWTEQEYWYGHHLLSDLREILTLRQEVERLKAEVETKNHDIIEAVKKARTQWAREDVEAIKKRESEVAARAVEGEIMKAAHLFTFSTDKEITEFEAGMRVLDYLKQLREQGNEKI